MKKIGLFIILIYQKFLRETLVSLGFASDCCFIPTCSEYTKEAVIKYGFLKGLYFGVKRVSRCGLCRDRIHDPLV
jgi:uncharacterized protein